VRHPPRACFTLFAPAFSEFGLADVRPHLLAMPARCLAIPTPSSASALAHNAPPPPLDLARALSRPIAPSWRSEFLTKVTSACPEIFLRVSPSLTSVSWPQPRHQVRRVVFPLSDQLRRPRNRRSTHPPQLRRLHRRGKER
jgi:hypothetical protein